MAEGAQQIAAPLISLTLPAFEAAQAVRQALSTTGFMVAADHGVPQVWLLAGAAAAAAR